MRTFVLQNDWSPLKTSSFKGHLDVVKALIKAGAIINQADKVSTHICGVIVIHLHNIYMCTLYDIIACDKYISLYVYM